MVRTPDYKDSGRKFASPIWANFCVYFSVVDVLCTYVFDCICISSCLVNIRMNYLLKDRPYIRNCFRKVTIYELK